MKIFYLFLLVVLFYSSTATESLDESDESDELDEEKKVRATLQIEIERLQKLVQKTSRINT